MSDPVFLASLKPGPQLSNIVTGVNLQINPAVVKNSADVNSSPAFKEVSGLGRPDKRMLKKELKEEIRAIKRNYLAQRKTDKDQSASKTAGLSFVLALLGVLLLFPGIFAIIYGIKALKKYQLNPGEKLKGLAIAGIIMGTVEVLALILAILYLILIILFLTALSGS